MKKNTPEEYKKAVKAKYDLVKDGDISGLLSNPSPGNIRELCVLTASDKMTKDDEVIFLRFFDVKKEENIVKHIEKFDIDKLRPVGHYLKGKTQDTKPLIIELIAILVDFTARPYGKFLKTIDEIPGNKEENEEIEENEELNKEPKNPERGPLVLLANEKAKASNSPFSFFTKQKKIVFSSIAGLFFAGYTAKDFIFPEKQCMEWKGDHYELVDCLDSAAKMIPLKPIAYDEVEFNRKKLAVCDTTTFFKNDRPIVWYSKKDNVVEFFNMDGIHPETNCELKKVTTHMIDKYVPPCK